MEITIGSDPFEVSNAVAVWVGVFINACVVIAAFAVQHRQSRNDLNLVKRAESTALSNAITAYGMMAAELASVAEWAARRDADGWEDQVAKLERRLRAVDFYLTQPVPAFSVIDNLIQARAEATSAIERLRATHDNDDDLDVIFQPLNLDVLAEEFAADRKRWEALHETAQAAHLELE